MPRPHDLCARVQNAFRARRAQVAVPHTVQNLNILAGFLVNLTRGTISRPSPTEFLSAPDSHRRVWADSKYRDDRPVLNAMELISGPRVFLDVDELRRVVTGRRANFEKPMGLGEVAVVKTRDKTNEWLGIREALRLGLGGRVLCRAR